MQQANGPATRTRTALGDISNKGINAKTNKLGAAKNNVTAKASSWLDSKVRSTFSDLAHAEARVPKQAEHLLRPVDKVDASDMGNAQAVVPYLQDIYTLYRDTEAASAASATYMTKQTDINEKMRAILIDWLVEVHLKFKLMVETLYLTVNLIDLFLEKEKITRNKLQLVGVTAMFLASKYEEIYAPECRDFVYISDKAYSREQILAMEGNMLAKLNFRLTYPNAFVFLKRYCKVAGILTAPTRSKTELLANYFVELTLQEYKMLKYLPSMIAASAVNLALKTMGQPSWSAELHQHTQYLETGLLPCVREMHALHKAAATNSLQAVRKKYAQEKHGAVSGIPPASL